MSDIALAANQGSPGPSSASVLGAGALSAFGNVLSLGGQLWSAERQIDFQREMASTQHQRAVKDLRKAGLNPILAAGGPGASAPMGAIVKPDDPVTPAINSALAAKRLNAELEVLKSQAFKNKAEEAESIGRGIKLGAEYDLINEQKESEKVRRHMVKLGIPEATASANMWRNIKGGGKAAQFAFPFLNMLLRETR